MMEIRRPSSCPKDDELAAFIAGDLEPRERAVIVAHLDSCPSCYEAVTEALAIEREDVASSGAGDSPKGAGDVVPLRRGIKSLPVWTMALAATVLLALGALALWRLASGAAMSTSRWSALASIDPSDALGSGWNDPPLTNYRGGGGEAASGQGDREVAFQLGVRTVELSIALGRRDAEGSKSLLATLRHLLDEGVSLSGPIADFYDLLEDELDAGSPTPHLLERAGEIAGYVRDAVDKASFELGQWAEAGRLGLRYGTLEADSSRFRRRGRALLRSEELSAEDAAALRTILDGEPDRTELAERIEALIASH